MRGPSAWVIIHNRAQNTTRPWLPTIDLISSRQHPTPEAEPDSINDDTFAISQHISFCDVILSRHHGRSHLPVACDNKSANVQEQDCLANMRSRFIGYANEMHDAPCRALGRVPPSRRLQASATNTSEAYAIVSGRASPACGAPHVVHHPPALQAVAFSMAPESSRLYNYTVLRISWTSHALYHLLEPANSRCHWP